ncbi:zinc finger protein 32-like [Cheilinus undulatus]|uniref:zinc finger protein 32-like n=1 Tax=Cheilinus undulatus TaxID=241271 RepID=UPI001BD68C28|nr:zinc finger protein 32-like [Cheilinus undulatus]
MFSTENLRSFIMDRLTAAAEDIFVVFQRTIVEYEEKIDRQRRLLDITGKTHVDSHRIDVPQQHECKEGEVVADQQLCDQERTFSLDQEEPEPPQMKEEQEDLCSSLEIEQLRVKQETETFMWTHTYEDSDHSEPEQQHEQHLLFHNSHVTENQDPKGGKHEDSESSGTSEPTLMKRLQKRRIEKIKILETDHNSYQSKKSFTCDTCGEEVKSKSELKTHQRAHGGKKMHSCEICGKMFSFKSDLTYHTRSHTGERPFSCSICGKRFFRMTNLNTHYIVHTHEKPFACETCGKMFRDKFDLKIHMRIHTGERPYACVTCGASFATKSNLDKHKRIHTG